MLSHAYTVASLSNPKIQLPDCRNLHYSTLADYLIVANDPKLYLMTQGSVCAGRLDHHILGLPLH